MVTLGVAVGEQAVEEISLVLTRAALRLHLQASLRLIHPLEVEIIAEVVIQRVKRRSQNLNAMHPTNTLVAAWVLVPVDR
jgi:hypothetical protein